MRVGADAVREAEIGGAMLNGHDASGAPRRRRTLRIGSDNEIAERIAEELRREFTSAVYDLGQVYVWSGLRWRPLPREELVPRVRAFDGASYPTGETRKGCLRLSRRHIDSVLSILEGILAKPDFFSAAPQGINAANGFLVFDKAGQPSLDIHRPEHRQRHVLRARWRPDLMAKPPAGSLMHQLLQGCFLGDVDAAEKADLLGEAAGAAALGAATRIGAPKALILYGPTAENGKSQVLKLMRALLPPDALTEVSPARFGDEKYLVHLQGKLLNATDEMGGGAIFSDAFKSVVTGEWTQARDLYRSVVRFQPRAMHVLACNDLPRFAQGMDAGVRRRLLVLRFNRRIPQPGPGSERIENIGERIGKEEADLLLRWAAEGASRLVARQGFSDLASCREELAEWILSNDPVAAWLRDPDEVTVTGDPAHAVHSTDAYRRFQVWAREEGLPLTRIPAKAALTARINSNAIPGLAAPRRGSGAVYVGMRLGRTARASTRDAAGDHHEAAATT
jgi:phage/plasmid-associated DNA primase